MFRPLTRSEVSAALEQLRSAQRQVGALMGEAGPESEKTREALVANLTAVLRKVQS